MALVDYGSYSDSEEELEDESAKESIKNIYTLNKATNENISKIAPVDHSSFIDDQGLPKLAEFKFRLPTPKALSVNENPDEIDDEFLQKKPTQTVKLQQQPPKRKETVKILIPSLADLKDDKSTNHKSNISIGPQKPKPCGLLGMLPKPKSGNLIIPHRKPMASTKPKTMANKLKPQPAIENKSIALKQENNVDNLENDGDGADDPTDSLDFFSLNATYELPEENEQKIKEIINEKVANIGRAARKLALPAIRNPDPSTEYLEEISGTSSKMDQETMQALCGSTAKRSRTEPVDVIELSADEVLPDKNEWLRHQLQASTEYQPRGLVDEEPAAGTRKKHQITYLAHQAKANEQELQAMWASNRHARRLTQNKYGF